MIRSSVLYTITFLFFLAIVSIFLAFLYLMQYDKQNYTKELNAKYSFVANATFYNIEKNTTNKELQKQFSSYQMEQITNSIMKDYIINKAKVLQEIRTKLGTASILTRKKNHYLKIKHNDRIILLKDASFQPYRYDVIKLIFAGIFTTTFIVYILTIRKLKPLGKLKKQIDKFAMGELKDITYIPKGHDEISEVTKAFNNAVSQIKTLNKSRQLFLRNIMHELKTPITKGRITAEMIPKDKNQQRLINTFVRLEELINEFAFVEQISSGANFTNLKPYRLVDLLDEAIDLAMIDKKNITLNVEDIILNVDFKYFSIALKNMIDNGIKYSTNNHVSIEANKNNISFINKGEKLEHEISHYIEPFVQGEYNVKSKSFGLGLYIVDNILKSHNLKFDYKYEDGFSTFIFLGVKNIIKK